MSPHLFISLTSVIFKIILSKKKKKKYQEAYSITIERSGEEIPFHEESVMDITHHVNVFLGDA